MRIIFFSKKLKFRNKFDGIFILNKYQGNFYNVRQTFYKIFAINII